MARRINHDPTIGKRIEARRKLRGWSIRFAADRAGVAHTTWSRIERGQSAADNRFMLADIAQALECRVGDLTGIPMTPRDPQVILGQAGVAAIRLALLETDLDEEPLVPPRPLPELERETALVRDLRCRTDYAGIGTRLPGLLRELHAVARSGERERIERETGLRLFVHAAYDAASTARDLGYPAEAWLAAERARQAATALADPVQAAVAEFCRAHTASACGTYARGLRLATRAVDALQPHLSRPDALPMLGLLQLTCGFTSYATHDLDAGHRWVAEAAAVAERTGETDVMGFGPTNVRIWQVSMEVDGGDPGRAAEIAASTNPTLVRHLPSRVTTFHVDTARALSRLLGREQAAVRHLLIAERTGPQMVRASATVREAARSLLDRTGRDASGSQLRGLCERVGVSL